MASTSHSITLELETDEDLSTSNLEGAPFTIGLLLDAIEKERKSLDVVEDCMKDLETTLKNRRRSINEQSELLTDLAKGLNATNKGN